MWCGLRVGVRLGGSLVLCPSVSLPSLPSIKGSDDEAAAVYQCTISNIDGLLVAPDCEVMMDTGNLRCDLYLPVRDIRKLQLKPSHVTKLAKPIDSAAIVIRQFEPVEISIAFKEAADKVSTRRAVLEVFGNDSEFQQLVAAATAEAEAAAKSKPPEKQTAASPSSAGIASSSHGSPRASASAFSASIPPVNQLTPIKHMAGTSKARVIMGKSGMKKLSIKYDSESNHISLLDEPVWEM